MDPLHKRAIGVVLTLLWAVGASAQTRFHSPTPNGATSSPGFAEPAVIGSSIIVSVVDEAGMPLDKQAIVKLFDESTQLVTWGSTEGRTEAQFDNVKAGQYEIEASAPGFKTTRQELTATSSHEAYRVLIALPRDVSGTVTDTKAGQILAPKARRDVDKGIAALERGNAAEAQKYLKEAYKLAPGNADVNYLLGLVFVERKDAGQAKSYLDRTLSLDPRHVGALTALGQLLLQQGDLAGATAVLEPAVAIAPKHWRAQWLLADAYLKRREFEKARAHAELAVQESKGGAVEARLILGEALVGLGRSQDAIGPLEAFVQQDPNNPAASGVRDLIARLRRSPPDPAGSPR
ncbi:MAG TPA: tetratricopeptide repeat protein [Candidatus Acidoferrum sp.]|nr:tetratricopeptide repeat protein [Candidatus Acidoferrum sp.]